MNHGQDTVSGEIVRSLCDEFESLLGTYHSHTTSTGGRYDNPEILLEALIEHLRNEVPEPEEEEIEGKTDVYKQPVLNHDEVVANIDPIIKAALEDEGDSI